MLAMPTALSLVLLSFATPVAEAPPPAAPHGVGMAMPALLPASLLMQMPEEGRDLGTGLRNMVVGAAVGGVGALLVLAAAGVFVGTVAVLGLMSFVIPGFFTTASPVMMVAILVASGLVIGGMLTLVAGGLWFGINGLLVLVRVLPGYKPSPATAYLSP